jgi:small-conductance mechanosensitive channel/CRP-like cAMP-binding protein
MDLVLLLRDPFVQTGLLAVVGALVTRILLRRYPAWRLGFQLAFFLALTALLHHHGIVPYELAAADTPIVERVFIATAKVIWWVNAAWLLTGGTRLFLVFERRPREGRLIQDLVVGVIYLSAALSVVAYVFGAPVGTLIATSGVFAVILGLAMQSTLADVFSGIALNFSKAYEVGDWIVLSDGLEGRVVETNWRATHLLSASNDLVVLPNSGLAKAQLTNLSSPNRSHGVKLTVRVVPTMAPSGISEIMRTVLLSSNTIMSVPAPSVEIKSLDAQAVAFELSFRVKDFATAAAARHEVYDLIYRHSRAAGLMLAQPAGAAIVGAAYPTAAGAAALPRPTTRRLIDAVPLFASLTEEEKEALAATMKRRTYRKGEVLAEQGARLESLFIVRTGVVALSRIADGVEVEVSRLSPGDIFGDEGAVASRDEPGTLRALTFAVVYEIDKASLANLLRDRPVLSDEIAIALSQRTGGTAVATRGDGNDTSMRSVVRLVDRLRNALAVSQG